MSEGTVFWVLALLCRAVLGVGLYLMFPAGRIVGLILTLVGTVGLFALIAPNIWQVLLRVYQAFGVGHPKSSLALVMLIGALIGALVFGGIWWSLSTNVASTSGGYATTSIEPPMAASPTFHTHAS